MTIEKPTVLITREENEHGPLSSLLRKKGFETLNIPTIAHQLLSSSHEVQSSADRIKEYDWVLFTSARGVEAFANACDGSFSSIGTRIGCVGKATADAVERFDGMSEIIARNAGSEGLVDALIARKAIRDKRFLYPTSDNARSTLAEGILRNGGVIDQVVAYRTASTNVGEQVARVLGSRHVNATVFCSPSAIEALEESLAALAALRDYGGLLIAMGPTTRAAIVTALGEVDVVEPDERTFEGITDILQRLMNRT